MVSTVGKASSPAAASPLSLITVLHTGYYIPASLGEYESPPLPPQSYQENCSIAHLCTLINPNHHSQLYGPIYTFPSELSFPESSLRHTCSPSGTVLLLTCPLHALGHILRRTSVGVRAVFTHFLRFHSVFITKPKSPGGVPFKLPPKNMFT